MLWQGDTTDLTVKGLVHGWSKGLCHDDQFWQYGLGRDHGNEHDQTGEQTEGNRGDEVGQGQDTEADDDGH